MNPVKKGVLTGAIVFVVLLVLFWPTLDKSTKMEYAGDGRRIPVTTERIKSHGSGPLCISYVFGYALASGVVGLVVWAWAGRKRGMPQPSEQQPRKGVIMFRVLRFIRGVCGFIFALQIFGLLPMYTWLLQPDAITGHMLALAFCKVIVLVVFGGLFFALRIIINRLHAKKHGVPHPALAKTTWAV